MPLMPCINILFFGSTRIRSQIGVRCYLVCSGRTPQHSGQITIHNLLPTAKKGTGRGFFFGGQQRGEGSKSGNSTRVKSTQYTSFLIVLTLLSDNIIYNSREVSLNVGRTHTKKKEKYLIHSGVCWFA